MILYYAGFARENTMLNVQKTFIYVNNSSLKSVVLEIMVTIFYGILSKILENALSFVIFS